MDIRIYQAIVVAFLLLALLFSCVTPGIVATSINIDKSRIYEVPFDKVWPAIIAGVAETNLNITALEKDSGLIAISNASYSSNDAFEGTRGSVMGVSDQVVARVAEFNIFATRNGDSTTKVQVNTNFKMQIRSGNGSQLFPYEYRWEQSYSNGNVEKRILEGIAARITQQ